MSELQRISPRDAFLRYRTELAGRLIEIRMPHFEVLLPPPPMVVYRFNRRYSLRREIINLLNDDPGKEALRQHNLALNSLPASEWDLSVTDLISVKDLMKDA